MSGTIYAYSDEATLDKSIDAIRKTQSRSSLGGGGIGQSTIIAFAKITELVEGNKKVAKGVQVEFNASTQGFSEPSDPYTFDSEEADKGASSVFATSNIFSSEDLAVNDVVEIAFYPDSSGEGEWWARISGGAAQLQQSFIINLTSGSGKNYSGTIVGFPELGTVPVLAGTINDGLTLPFSVTYNSSTQSTVGEVTTFIIQPLVFL